MFIRMVYSVMFVIMFSLLEWLTPLCCENVMFIRMVYSVMFLIMFCLLKWYTPLYL